MYHSTDIHEKTEIWNLYSQNPFHFKQEEFRTQRMIFLLSVKLPNITVVKNLHANQILNLLQMTFNSYFWLFKFMQITKANVFQV